MPPDATPDPSTTEADTALKPGSVPSGSGFRAVLTRGGEIVWRCPHVHFTDHSAKAEAEQQLRRMSAEAPARAS